MPIPRFCLGKETPATEKGSHHVDLLRPLLPDGEQRQGLPHRRSGLQRPAHHPATKLSFTLETVAHTRPNWGQTPLAAVKNGKRLGTSSWVGGWVPSPLPPPETAKHPPNF